MGIVQARPRRKISGGRYVANRGKRKYEKGNRPTLTKLGSQKGKTSRERGGNTKLKLLSADKINVYDPSSKKYVQANIKTVVENPANRHYVRRNILTKGTIVDTDKGKAKITNRPGQENVVNAILVK